MNTKTVVLPNILDLKAAGPLTEKLLPLRGHDLLIDASQVERVGGQCLQVLISAASTWQADGATADILNPSDGFVEGLAALGMRPEDLFSSSEEQADRSAA
jgi:chemotaxis protein CheX